MKALSLSICLLCGLAAAAQTPPGVIGINTVNPRGVLHIDGASTPTTTNPSAGSISPTQASDDVVVDASGRIGIGLLEPEAKADILSGTPGALRIQNGTEGEGKYLFSDAAGTGTWTPLAAGSWYAALYDGELLGYNINYTVRALSNYSGSLISSTGGGSVNATAGSVTVPVTGKYRITISVYWTCDRTAPYLTKVILRVNGSNRKTFTFWGAMASTSTTTYEVQPSFIGVLDLNAGQVLTLATDETQANYANQAQGKLFLVELLL
jgi:hypothetical protein